MLLSVSGRMLSVRLLGLSADWREVRVRHRCPTIAQLVGLISGVAAGQSWSRAPGRHSNLFVNQTAQERHPMKSIKTNLATASQLGAP